MWFEFIRHTWTVATFSGPRPFIFLCVSMIITWNFCFLLMFRFASLKCCVVVFDLQACYGLASVILPEREKVSESGFTFMFVHFPLGAFLTKALVSLLFNATWMLNIEQDLGPCDKNGAGQVFTRSCGASEWESKAVEIAARCDWYAIASCMPQIVHRVFPMEFPFVFSLALPSVCSSDVCPYLDLPVRPQRKRRWKRSRLLPESKD